MSWYTGGFTLLMISKNVQMIPSTPVVVQNFKVSMDPSPSFPTAFLTFPTSFRTVPYPEAGGARVCGTACRKVGNARGA